MPLDVSCRLMFLASPGGLSDERDRCRTVIRRFNETRTVADEVCFYVHAWEDVPGGVGRPQDRINPNLDDSDYVLLLFGDRWGSPPAHGGPYTSGTEEEFFRALELLADPARPMRDILVLFKTLPSDRLADPGPGLQKVLDFRARLEASKTLMYEVFDSLENLDMIVTRKLTEWSKPLEAKEPITVTIPAAVAETGADSTDDPSELLETAKAAAASGRLVQAEAVFARATQDGAPAGLLEFARFMRRTGQPKRALEINRQVIANLVGKPDDRSTVEARVSALANIGVIHRKQGHLSESSTALREAVETAAGSPDPVYDVQGYALDNYGLTLLKAGHTDVAFEQFKLADTLRRDFGTADQRAQSSINLGRRYLALGQLDEAHGYFETAVGDLSDSEDDHLKANVAAGLAETLIRLGQDKDAEVQLEASRTLNDRLQNLDGLSITHGLWARLLLRQSQLVEAERHISEAEEVVSRTGNPQGRCVVAWLRAEHARLSGDLTEAAGFLDEANDLCARYADTGLESDIAATRALLQGT
jgi:tetratricopeptide (TPR) repeat protein